MYTILERKEGKKIQFRVRNKRVSSTKTNILLEGQSWELAPLLINYKYIKLYIWEEGERTEWSKQYFLHFQNFFQIV